MSQTPAQLEERRVKEAHNRYKKAREALDAYMESNFDVFQKAYDLVDTVNTARKRFEQACRETGIGVGPITVVAARKVNFDADYLETLFEEDPILPDLVKVAKSVNKKVFEQLVAEGRINKKQAKRAIVNEETSYRINGVPHEIVLP
jgi:hypothetical protein